jgi:hypothetical protein
LSRRTSPISTTSSLYGGEPAIIICLERDIPHSAGPEPSTLKYLRRLRCASNRQKQEIAVRFDSLSVGWFSAPKS